MKKTTILIALLGITFSIQAQQKVKLEDNSNANYFYYNNGRVGIGTATPTSSLEVQTLLSSPSTYEIQKWTNTHNNGYDLSLKTKWDGAGINHFFVQKYNNIDYNSLSFFSGNVGIGTVTPTSSLEVQTLLSSPSTYETQKWTNTHNNGYDLSLKTKWDGAGINHFFVQKYNNIDYNSLSFFSGNVGIGTTTPDMKLTVKGSIHAEEVKIDLSVPAPDYVFGKEYNLISIAEVEKYILKNSHLPEIPSAKEFAENGVLLAAMNMSLLKKIEELTLYTIQQQKEIEELKSMMDMLFSSKK